MTFTLTAVARPVDARAMLEEICEHFIEHAEVIRTEDGAVLRSVIGKADIRERDGKLLIALACPTEQTLQISRNVIAEHLFMFAKDEPFELVWADAAGPAKVSDLYEVTVVATEEITPRMRRVILACADVTPFLDEGLHVRLLLPPKGRPPVWPWMRPDGRIAWPDGEDALLVRIYTIRAVDAERGHLWVDILQHQSPGLKTPGSDFGVEARPGDTVALMGPGGGGVPQAGTMLLAGDETALPAIARIAAEVPAGTRMTAIIEVADEAERQPLPTAGTLDLRWLYRKDYPPGAADMLAQAVESALEAPDGPDYVWIGCEAGEARRLRTFLKKRGHPKSARYVAAYWQK